MTVLFEFSKQDLALGDVILVPREVPSEPKELAFGNVPFPGRVVAAPKMQIGVITNQLGMVDGNNGTILMCEPKIQEYQPVRVMDMCKSKAQIVGIAICNRFQKTLIVPIPDNEHVVNNSNQGK